MSARNHKKSGNEWIDTIGLNDSATGYTINITIPAGRKGLVLCAAVSQCKTSETYVSPSTPSVKYGGSSGVAFTSRQNATIQHHIASNPYMEVRSTLLTYDVPEGDSGTKAIYISVSSAPDDGRVFIYLLYGAQYGTSSNGSGTASSTTLSSTLALGGYLIGQVYHVDATPAITGYNGAVIVSSGSETYTLIGTSITMMNYIKIGSQSKTVTGGGTWGSSKKYIHTRCAFNALGKEYI
jgi:hypothetical protein